MITEKSAKMFRLLFNDDDLEELLLGDPEIMGYDDLAHELLDIFEGEYTYQYNEALDYDDEEDLEEEDEVALDDLNEEDDKVSLDEA